MSNTRSTMLQATLVAAACLVVLSPSLTAQAALSQETVVRNHITVTQNDVHAAGNVRNSSYHALAAQVPGAKALTAALNAEGVFRPEVPTGPGAQSTAPNAVLTTPFFFPADLKRGTGAVLATTTHHALYVDYSGTVAAN